MDSIKTIAPIFIGRTRSFWLGIVPAILTLIDVIAGSVGNGTAEPIASGLAAILGPLTGVTAEGIHGFMLAVAPLCALIVAHQRGGLARPYTASPAKERELLRTIEDGRSAFEAGKAFGERLLQTRSKPRTLAPSTVKPAPKPKP